MLTLPEVDPTGSDAEISALARKVDRGYFRSRVRRFVGLDGRDAAAVKRKYDRIAGSYQAAEQSLDASKKSLAIVNGKIGFANHKAMLEATRSYIAQRINELECSRILEVGAGELNTLIPVVEHLAAPPMQAVGVDLSAQRLIAGAIAPRNEIITGCVAADATALPFADKSFDLIFTYHCLEQCPTLLRPALREFARVAGRYVMLVEPAYELAHSLQRKRIRKVGYVRGIVQTARQLGFKVTEHSLLPARFYLNGSALTQICLRH